jgi:hypothetical protein
MYRRQGGSDLYLAWVGQKANALFLQDALKTVGEETAEHAETHRSHSKTNPYMRGIEVLLFAMYAR